MLDSFNQKQRSAAFDPRKTYDKICMEKGFVSHVYQVKFPKGWIDLIDHMVDEIKDQPVKILSIEDNYGQLEVDFERTTQRLELKIWRLLHDLKVYSRETCMTCGEHTSDVIVDSNRRIYCSDCFDNVATRNDTGTWLDNI